MSRSFTRRSSIPIHAAEAFEMIRALIDAIELCRMPASCTSNSGANLPGILALPRRTKSLVPRPGQGAAN